MTPEPEDEVVIVEMVPCSVCGERKEYCRCTRRKAKKAKVPER